MTIVEIESAITQLSAQDIAELLDWLQQHYAQAWDRQIEDDLDAGRLDKLLVEVDKEHEEDLSRPLFPRPIQDGVA